jgi:hypothetical protein
MSQAKENVPKKPRRVFIVALCSIFLVIAALAPICLLLSPNRQFQVAGWGVRWLPAGHPWVRNTGGIRIVLEGVSATLGGESVSNGTHITTPPGLVDLEVKQWGRLQWWHTQVVKESGTFQQRDVEALTRDVMIASIQRDKAVAQRKAGTP